MPSAVGFDLDMTLVDSSDGIVATVQQVVAELGGTATREQLWPSMGMPLEHVLGQVLAPDDVPAAAARYRELYPTTGVPRTVLLPGAAEALAAVRAGGDRVVVVSAKHPPAVHLVLAQVGVEADGVVGGLFGAAKAEAIRAEGVRVYLGDHPGDMTGALAAGAVAVGVLTGPHDGAALRAAGVDVVLGSVADLPAWLAGEARSA
ncbi:HAD family hydrolase [Angustibacter aerolatus]